ncbi:MAG TPA: glycosyltransferase family 1 protein [Acidimicrobiales bacterium]|nr:glycosyltransferase family 1 protein [Acidimicrobiales bacterium]
MKVLVDARIESGRAGGLEQAVIALATSLARSEDQRDEISFLTLAGGDGWLRDHVGDGHIVTCGQSTLRQHFRDLRTSPVGRRLLRLGAEARNWSTGPSRTVETVGGYSADVIHFPIQNGVPTRAPFIYQPWDLQHRHLPQFFTGGERRRRDIVYRSLCRAAAVVVVPTQWGKQDLIDTYSIDETKISVVPPSASVLSLGPAPTETEILAARSVVGPTDYALFPAQAWPHKNHATLIAAIALLRARGTDIAVVCCGATNPEAVAALEAEAGSAGVGDLLVFPGYLPQQLMRPLYEEARCMVFASLFEGWGLPVIEAFELGIPVVTSHRGSLCEVAGEAAEICDPASPESLAEAIARVWLDEGRRASLVEAGRERAARLTWSSIGDSYRRIYRSAVQRESMLARDVRR